jgi:predicted benzoate:H+ symporter BenE
MPERKGDPLEMFLAAAQMAAGALIFGLCGACTLRFLGTSLVTMVLDPSLAVGALTGLAMVAVVGGLPTAIGFLIMRGGYRWYRAAKAKPPPSAPPPG